MPLSLCHDLLGHVSYVYFPKVRWLKPGESGYGTKAPIIKVPVRANLIDFPGPGPSPPSKRVGRTGLGSWVEGVLEDDEKKIMKLKLMKKITDQ